MAAALPWLPEVTSWNQLGFAAAPWYIVCAGNGSVLPCAAWIRVQKPAHSGAASEVPPICSCEPLIRTRAPELGLASNEMSGTPRIVELPSTPAAICQLGAFSVSEGPPPAPPDDDCWQLEALVQDHTVSPVQVEPVVDSVVPPTAMT